MTLRETMKALSLSERINNLNNNSNNFISFEKSIESWVYLKNHHKDEWNQGGWENGYENGFNEWGESIT